MPTRYDQRNARLDALEATYAPRIRAALVRQAASAIARLEQLDTLTPVTADLLAALIRPDRLLPVLEALYVACGTVEAADTYDWLTEGMKAQAPPGVRDSWAGRLRRFISTEGAAAVRGITDTTRGIVRRVLNESATAGHGIAEAARNLRAEVATLARSRSVVIARTELLTAANYSSLMGAQATGLRLEKFWLATPDGRTRQSHRNADGQGAPLQDGFFSVGGFQARYPADPMLPASERCACRCSVGYRVPA